MLHPFFFSYQESVAQRALDRLDENIRATKLANVTMVYDIDEHSQLVRGYLSHGKFLDSKNAEDKVVIDVLDKSFHAWLMKNKYVMDDDGVIYKSEKYKNAKPTIKADPQQLSALLEDESKGLAKKQEHVYKLEVRHQDRPAAEGEKSQAPQSSAGG